MMPAHSSEGYKLAAEQGADFIECDLAVTKDWPQNLTYYKKGQPDRDSEKQTHFSIEVAERPHILVSR